jgi:serine protease AprX
VASAAALVAGALALPAGASAGLAPGRSPYIVGDLNGVGAGPALSAVAGTGGQVLEQLGAANAVLADLTPFQVSLLDLVPGLVLTPDVAVSVQATSYSDPPHTPSTEFVQQTGAAPLWAAGDTGSGVNVAVLDTGIDALPDFAGRLVGGVDLSGGGNPFEDSYGHGTFVAGLVAGDGASSNGAYTGEAPGAGLVSVKVAGASGMTDLATVIAGVGWTIDNQQALHIGVLNMSLGYEPIESTALDPVDIAVEKAWNDGIVVVTSAGNAGPFNGTILSPGDDPLVVTVGALDDLAQPDVADDVMANFSSVGPTNPDGWFKPDLVTSGRSVVSLAAPGSTVYDENPGSLVGSGNFVGSGTSFAAAITSGAAALLLEQHPSDTPDMVKAALLGSTLPGPVGNPVVDGHGALDIASASALSPQPNLTQFPSVVDVAMGTTVSLFSTWTESSWNPVNWTGTAWEGTAWEGTAWEGTAWNGTAWNGTAWNGTAWNGTAWEGTAWEGTAWEGTAWEGTAWEGTAWNGTAWEGSEWD